MRFENNTIRSLDIKQHKKVNKRYLKKFYSKKKNNNKQSEVEKGKLTTSKTQHFCTP